jgi:hypothetical protein
MAFAEAPDCWTVDGAEIGKNAEGIEIADGQFLLTVEISKISKDDLILIMTKVGSGNLKPGAYPNIIGDSMIFFIDTIKENADRNALKEAVSMQIEEMAAIPGVQMVGCNAISRPSGR